MAPSDRTPEGSFLRIFLQFLIPRVLLSLVFSYLGYLGSGGDPTMYQLLGGYLRDLFMDPSNASLMVRAERHQLEFIEDSYLRLVEVSEQLYGGVLDNLWGDAGLSIIILHAVFYALWDNIVFVVLVQSLLNALAYAWLLRSRPELLHAKSLLRWNPVSIFYCATHFKESFTESCLLLFLARGRGAWGWVWKIFALLFLFFLRAEHFIFVGIFLLVYNWKSLAATPYPKIILGMLALFLILPKMYADWMIDAGSAGAIFSLVYANEITRRVLGPLIGLIQPMPFLLPLNYPAGIFHTVYGLAYYFVWYRILRLDFKSERFRGNVFLTASMLILLVISYRFTGQSGTKDRYFAPYFPLLLLGFSLKRKEAKEGGRIPPLPER